MIRRQPPVLAPLSAGALTSAVARTLLRRDDTARLEDIVRKRYDAEEVVLCGSGTQALQLAMTLCAREAVGRTRVALPAFGCYDLATAALGAGLPVSLYDLDPETLAPDLQSLRLAIDGGARVVVITPLFGIPVDWAAIDHLSNSSGAVLIEDAAQGYGGSLDRRRLGALGGTSIISFGRGKGWTGGTGGAFLRRRLPRTDNKGRMPPGGIGMGAITKAAVQWALARPSVYGLPSGLPFLGLGETVFHAPSEISALPRASASLLTATAELAEAAAAGRRSRGATYRTRLESHRGLIAVLPSAEAGYVRFPLCVTDAMAAVAGLRRYGVAPTYPGILAHLPELRPLLDDRDRCGRWPGATALVRGLITLPTHAFVTDADVDRIVEGVGSMEPE